MQQYARLIGVDVGKKRIGLAQTDLLKTIASPVGTFSPDEIFRELVRMVNESPVEAFIIGWPLDPEGQEGAATQMVSRFIRKLEAEFPDIPVHKVDERYTSKRAKEIMREIGVPKMKRREKERVDRIAAAVILQHYLDSTD